MTPKEKADKLIEGYYQLLKDKLDVNDAYYYCKQCALMLIDEVLNEIVSADFKDKEMYSMQRNYWLDVKQDMQKF